MSIQVIARVLPKRLGSPARKIVALKLADVAHEDGGRIYPSVETIAAQCELSERQTQYVLREFVKNGLLIVVQKGGGRCRPTHYRYDLDAIDKLPDAKSAEGEIEPQSENPVAETGERQKGALTAPFTGERVHCTVRKGALTAPNPSLPLTSSSKKPSVSDETGGEPPSVNAEIWDEGLYLLGATSLPEPQQRKLVGRWCKRAPSEEDKKKLLAILRAARRAGTGDPVSYVTAALNREFPPPPDPSGFDDAIWRRNIQAALNMRSWTPAWGPPPGSKGCKAPAAMITPELMAALRSQRRPA